MGKGEAQPGELFLPGRRPGKVVGRCCLELARNPNDADDADGEVGYQASKKYSMDAEEMRADLTDIVIRVHLWLNELVKTPGLQD